MEEGSKKFEKVLEKLRKSKPVMHNCERLAENVILQIQKERTTITLTEIIYEFLFGWVYIGWIRRIMVTAAAIVILFFGYQQVVILKRINALSGKTYIETGAVKTGLTDDLPGTINKYKLFGKKLSAGELYVSEKEIRNFIKSVNDIQVRYRDLFEMIEKDPELKKYVEERINKTEMTKPNK